MAGKKIGFTTTIASSTSGTIASVRSISGPNASGDSVDTTTLDSTSRYRTFIGALVDGGEVTFDLIYDTEEPSHQTLAQFLSSQDTKSWTITYPSTFTAQTFSGHVTGLGAETPLDDVITQPVTIKVSGTPGFSS